MLDPQALAVWTAVAEGNAFALCEALGSGTVDLAAFHTKQPECVAAPWKVRHGRGFTFTQLDEFLSAYSGAAKVYILGYAALERAATLVPVLMAHGASLASPFFDTDDNVVLTLQDALGSNDAEGILEQPDPDNGDGADVDVHGDPMHVRHWLRTMEQWSPLHYIDYISRTRARELLRSGADLNAEPAPTPLARARQLQKEGRAGVGTAAALVLSAAGPWSRQAHGLFPARARAYAWMLVCLGSLLSQQPRFGSRGQVLMDVWVDVVLPLLVTRESESA